ncbi:MAG: UPF0280 family protein [Pseudomonadota bacterium]
MTFSKPAANTARPRASSARMNEPQASRLPGNRLHLHHGPIDLIIGGTGAGLETAFAHATDRFQTILTELVAEHDTLCRPAGTQSLTGPTAKRMDAACAPFSPEVFVTPMAAVAGSVADETLAAALGATGLSKLYVNNGGDIAFHLSPAETVTALGANGDITITHDDPARGVATSGWRGRSLSFGIADAVTVLAKTAATADVAATLIANEVDLPGHGAIKRRPASDSEIAAELEDRMVTEAVGPLTQDETTEALANGAAFAQTCLSRDLICGAQLSLNGQTETVQPRT